MHLLLHKRIEYSTLNQGTKMTTLTLPAEAFEGCEIGETKNVSLSFTVTGKDDETVTGDAEVLEVESAEGVDDSEGEDVAEYDEDGVDIKPKVKSPPPKVSPGSHLPSTIVLVIGGKKQK